MRQDERISLIIIAIAAGIFYFFVIPEQVSDPPIASVSPRLVPRISTAVIGIVALAKFLQSLRFPTLEPYISRRNYLTLLGGMVILLVAAFVMASYVDWVEPLGMNRLRPYSFWSGAAIIVVAFTVFSGERNALRVVLYSTGLLVVSYILLVQIAGFYIP